LSNRPVVGYVELIVTEPPLDTAAKDRWMEAVHARYGGALFVYACRALDDRAAAEEVVQDALVRAWQAVDRFDPARAALSTWLFTITRNLVIDRRRRRRIQPVDPATMDLPADDGGLDRALEVWQVAEALGRISPDHRAVIVETYYRGASVAEAAERLDIPRGTVKSRLYYGLRALRLALEEMGVVG
jgi:RNA polymerase sigma-70 factor, ECF subfamily